MSGRAKKTNKNKTVVNAIPANIFGIGIIIAILKSHHRPINAIPSKQEWRLVDVYYSCMLMKGLQ